MRNPTDIKMPDFCSRPYPFHYATALNLLRIMGVDVNRVDILAAGEYENYKGEVREQKPAAGTPLDANTRITLIVGYPSAVDQIPYQFFYGLQGGTSRASEWEGQARRLMAPFDAAVIRHGAAALYHILKFDCLSIDRQQLSLYLDLFDFDFTDSEFDQHEALTWALLLPTFHLWSGNADRVEQILGYLLGYQFKIIENIASRHEIPPEAHYRLGSTSGRLGKETLLGRSFVEYDSAYQVVVNGVKREDVSLFLPGGSKRKKLEWLLGICMPNNLDYVVTVNTDSATTVLGSRERGGHLGYSARL